jgi:hypothetical protein
MIHVYYGAALILVGTLSARRQAELLSLLPESAIDISNRYLIFLKGKSTRGVWGTRQKELRPIDEIAVAIIKNIEKFQIILKKYGVLQNYSPLFFPPSTGRPQKLSANNENTLNGCLDLFCDYFETPVINNQRYYLRQHQLRRFFAMTFFWGGSYKGLDTLSWYLGHTDFEHLYRYISEEIDGAVLMDVKVQYVYENLVDFKDLTELLKANFGVQSISVLSSEDAEQYIETLIKNETVEVEPEFIHLNNNISYKIIVKIDGVRHD